MIEKNKKHFSELLRKIDATDTCHSPSRIDKLDKFFQNVQHEYRKIQCDVATKLENLKITSDILNESHGRNNIKKNEDDSLKLATDKAIAEVTNFAFFEIQGKLSSFNLKKGKQLFEQDRIEEALDAWEEVLKVNPDNEYIRSKLEQIIDS